MPDFDERNPDGDPKIDPGVNDASRAAGKGLLKPSAPEAEPEGEEHPWPSDGDKDDQG